MARELKARILKELEREFHDIDQTGCVMVQCDGLSADASRRIRQRIRQQGGHMTVIKNSLFSLAMGNLGVGGIGSLAEGPSAVVRAENAVVAAKAVKEAAKENKTLAVLGGYAEGSVLDAAAVGRLADLPSREELLSMLIGQVVAPARRLLGCLLAEPTKMVSCIEQLQEADNGGEEAA